MHIGDPIAWEPRNNQDEQLSHRMRSAARLIRSSFSRADKQVLGPTNRPRRLTIRDAVRNALDQLAEVDDSETTSKRFAGMVLNRMTAKMSYPVTKVAKFAVDWFYRRSYDAIHISGLEHLAEATKESTVIYLPLHRSYLDFIVLSYVLFQRGYAIPYIASGDNLNLPVVGGILRRLGAFYIKRSFNEDKAYKTLLQTYVNELIQQGNFIEFFVEGTRSRSGWQLPGQHGLLRTVIEAAKRSQRCKLAFVPVNITYEKVIELKGFENELRGGARQRESIFGVLRGIVHASRNLGQISVRFCEPIYSHPSTFESDVRSESHAIGKTMLANTALGATVTSTHLCAFAISNNTETPLPIATVIARIDQILRLLELVKQTLPYEIIEATGKVALDRTDALDLIALDTEQQTVVVLEPWSLTWLRNNVLHTLLPVAILLTRYREIRSEGQIPDSVFTIYEVSAKALQVNADAEILRSCRQDLLDNQYLSISADSIGWSDAPHLRDCYDALCANYDPLLTATLCTMSALSQIHHKAQVDELAERAQQITRNTYVKRQSNYPIELNARFFEACASCVFTATEDDYALQRFEDCVDSFKGRIFNLA